jgi:hypothetical protein
MSGVTTDGFFDGHSGQVFRAAGIATMFFAEYLHVNRFANMIGLYRLTRGQVARDIGLRDDEIAAAWPVIEAEDYAHYHAPSDSVWVVNMPRERVNGFKVGRPPTASQISTVHRLCAKAVDNFFYPQFFDRYGARFRLNPLGGDAPDPKPSGRNVALLSKSTYLARSRKVQGADVNAEPRPAAIDVTPTLPFAPTPDLNLVARAAMVKAELRYTQPTVAEYRRTFEELLRKHGVRR